MPYVLCEVLCIALLLKVATNKLVLPYYLLKPQIEAYKYIELGILSSISCIGVMLL